MSQKTDDLSEELRQKWVNSAVHNVKAKYQPRLLQPDVPDKRCMWCNTSLTISGSFCSDDCKAAHEKAVEEYELRRKDKDEMRYAR